MFDIEESIYCNIIRDKVYWLEWREKERKREKGRSQSKIRESVESF